jgi:hypothetical protein
MHEKDKVQSESLNGNDSSRDLGIHERILNCDQTGCDGVDWIHLAQIGPVVGLL